MSPTAMSSYFSLGSEEHELTHLNPDASILTSGATSLDILVVGPIHLQ